MLLWCLWLEVCRISCVLVEDAGKIQPLYTRYPKRVEQTQHLTYLGPEARKVKGLDY